MRMTFLNVFNYSLIPIGFFMISCGSNTQTSSDTLTTETVPDSAEQLAKTYCASCHDFVEPAMLDKTTWIESTIPWMAPKMGIYELDGRGLRSEKNDPNADPSLYPSKPMLSTAQLKAIMNYYKVKAPEALSIQKREIQIQHATSVFAPAFPQLPPTDPPMTTFVKILPQKEGIVVGVAGEHNRLGYFDNSLKPHWVQGMPSPPAWVDFHQAEWFVTCMGSVMPSNKKEGIILKLKMNGNQISGNPSELFKNLPRPVQAVYRDMDGNGSPDFLINGFGHLSGKLFWQTNASAKEHVLRDYPGAIHSEFTDWDGDGREDILTLFTQNREGIFLFRNLGNGKYEEKKLLGFEPVMGSSSFTLSDMNGDGKKDIIYTCGDNADYSVILKPYHGVYIYINKGNDQFEQGWFYPIHGCYKTLIRDFDLDGDPDMVTISFFADYLTQPNEALVYYENTGNLKFTPYAIEGFDKGRWLTADAGDIDGDGDEDIVVGNFALGPQSFMPDDLPAKFARQPVFMLLKNNTK